MASGAPDALFLEPLMEGLSILLVHVQDPRAEQRHRFALNPVLAPDLQAPSHRAVPTDELQPPCHLIPNCHEGIGLEGQLALVYLHGLAEHEAGSRLETDHADAVSGHQTSMCACPWYP